LNFDRNNELENIYTTKARKIIRFLIISRFHHFVLSWLFFFKPADFSGILQIRLAAHANKILILCLCFDIKSLHRNRRRLLMGFSGGFKQGKPGKALLELVQVCTSKIQVGQLGIAKRFNC
jgi:hypothetical protein